MAGGNPTRGWYLQCTVAGQDDNFLTEWLEVIRQEAGIYSVAG